MGTGRGTSLDDYAIEAIARRVVELLRGDAPESSGRRLVSAAEIAQRFGVSRQWVYENANRLGAVRLGGGDRPRLRFDLTLIEHQLTASGDHASPTSQRDRENAKTDPGDLIPLRGL